MEEYSFNVEEKSFTQAYLIRFIWGPIIQKMPSKITPNSITMVGFFFMLLSVFFVWLALQGEAWGFLLASVCLFTYTACDNLDGMHARRTGQSSKLGEFLDHWLDSVGSIFINLCCAISLGLDGPILVMYFIAIALAFFFTIWEHHHTGVFYSGAMGTNEALFLLMSFYIILFFFFGHPWLMYDPNTWNIALIMATVTVIVSLYTAISCIMRVRKHLLDSLPLFLVIAGVSLWALGSKNVPMWWAGILILGSNTLLCGRLLVDKLIERKSPYRNIIAIFFAIFALVLFFLPQQIHWFPFVLYTATALLALAILWDGTRAVYYLKQS